MKKILFIPFIVALLVSCGGNTDSETGTGEEVPQQTSKLEKEESEIEKRIADTDLQEKLEEVSSLYFTKEDGSSLEVKAFLNKSGEILKVEEKFVDKSKDSYGTNLFYIHKGKKYASKERFEEKEGNKTSFVERVSFYDEKEKVIQTKVRKADFEEDLDAQLFEIVTLNDCSIKRAMDAINQEGEFETRFQGFVHSGNSSYITVGQGGENGYISALILQYQSTTSNKLMKNQEKYLGTKLNLEFQKMVDENGFEFQVLMTLSEAK